MLLSVNLHLVDSFIFRWRIKVQVGRIAKVTWWKDCEGQMMDGNREKVRGWGKESPCFKSLKIVIWLRLRDADCTAAIVAHIPMCRSITNVRSETYHHPFSRPVLVILVFRVSSFDSFLLPSSFSGASLNLSSYKFFFFFYIMNTFLYVIYGWVYIYFQEQELTADWFIPIYVLLKWSQGATSTLMTSMDPEGTLVSHIYWNRRLLYLETRASIFKN